MKEPEQFVKRHCIIRISSIVDSPLFPHRQEKGERKFCRKEEKTFVLGDSFYSTPDLTLKFNILVPTPSGSSLTDHVSWKTELNTKVSL